MPPKRIAPKPKRTETRKAIKPKGGASVSPAKPLKKGGSKRGGAVESKEGHDETDLMGEKKHKKKKKKRHHRRKKRSNFFAKQWRKLFPSTDRPEMSKMSSLQADAAMLTNKELAKIKHVFDEVDVEYVRRTPRDNRRCPPPFPPARAPPHARSPAVARSGEGEMDFDEFFELLGEERTPFTDAVFTLLHAKESHVIRLDAEEERIRAEETGQPARRVAGALSFDDFLQLCLIYCRYSRDDILMFAFQAFDRDGSGVIDEDEFIELCATVNNMNPTFPGNFKRAMEEFDKNDDGECDGASSSSKRASSPSLRRNAGMIDFEEFCSLNRRYPLVLFPAFRLQDALQRESLSEETWVEIGGRNTAEREIDRYRRAHNGKYPVPPMSERVKRTLCGCCLPPDIIRLVKRKQHAVAHGAAERRSAAGVLGGSGNAAAKKKAAKTKAKKKK